MKRLHARGVELVGGDRLGPLAQDRVAGGGHHADGHDPTAWRDGNVEAGRLGDLVRFGGSRRRRGG